MKKLLFFIAGTVLSVAANATQQQSNTFCPSLSISSSLDGRYEYFNGTLQGGEVIYGRVNQGISINANRSDELACIASLGNSNCNSLGSSGVSSLFGDADVQYVFSYSGTPLNLGGTVFQSSRNAFLNSSTRGRRDLGVGALIEIFYVSFPLFIGKPHLNSRPTQLQK